MADLAPCSDASQVPGGPRIDGRVLIKGSSQYYVPFITIQASEAWCCLTRTYQRPVAGT